MPPLVPVPTSVWTTGHNATDFYETDQGRRMTLAKSVEASPRKYSSMRSSHGRFEAKKGVDTPFGEYEADSFKKSSIKRSVQDSPVKYAAAFANTERFKSGNITEAPDAQYDADAFRSASLWKTVQQTARTYTAMRSPEKRLQEKAEERPKSSPDRHYHTDQGRKKTLATSVRDSPIRYSILRSDSKRLARTSPSTSPALGPGAYDVHHPTDISSRGTKAMSSFLSKHDRSTAEKDPAKNLGSLFSQEAASKEWRRNGHTISQTMLRRPAYIPFEL